MPPKPRPHGKRKPPPPGSSTGLDRRLLIAAAAGVAVVVVAGAAFALSSGGDGGGDARAALEAAGCTLTVKPAVANIGDHSDFPNPDGRSPKWNTDPPTSGPHYGETIIYGAYAEPLQIGRLVHNLEHGAVFILYGDDVPATTVAQLRSFYGDHTNGTVLAPYPRLGKNIALGAWYARGLDEAKSERGSGVLATCPAFDENAFDAFLSAYQFEGPEPFPPDSLLPGRN
jgi:Protein of unknown function (DUF3105)